MDSVIFIIIGITVIMMIVIFSFVFNTKLRGKMLTKQVESLNHMLNESKDTFENLATTASSIGINSKKRILKEYGDTLKDLSTKEAEINGKAVSVTARAVKDGFNGENQVYCKYCGTSIESDSKFCKNCGKKQ